MENFLSLVVFIAIIVGVVSQSSKKAKKQAQTQARPGQPASAPAQPAPELKPMQVPVPRTEPAEMLPPRPEVRVTPHDHTDMFAGSMHAETTEGVDPHDHGFEQEPDMPSSRSDAELNASFAEAAPAESEEAEAPGLMDWTGSGIVRAVVMQEVLKRPSQCMAERR